MKNMFKLIIFSFVFFYSKFLYASEGIDSLINSWLSPISNKIAGMVFYSFNIAGADIRIIVLWLIAGALFCTFYFNFINLRMFSHAIDLVRGRYDKPNSKGEVSHFQALSTAISGTVGLGNIAGVAVAVAIGGPGATFWMILCGILGMSTKFVECTLGVKYREINNQGVVFGGPMYYLSKGLKEKGFVQFGKILAISFALLCVGASFGGGNAAQSNQAVMQLVSSFNLTGGNARTIIGIIMMIIVGVIILSLIHI